MKKILLILSIVLLSSCSKVNVLESCHYAQLISSYVSTETNDLKYCMLIYKEVETAKAKAKVSEDLLFGVDSIRINFIFPDDVGENYFLSKDGILSYDLEGIYYSTNIRKELFSELIENIDKQKESFNLIN